MRLVNRRQNLNLASDVRVARSFWARTKGLLGETGLPDGHALWIDCGLVGCNSIHTFFMRFAIDAVFVDRSLTVTKIYRELPPWRLTLPATNAHSVFELKAGALAQGAVEIGDQLHVGD